MTRLSVNLNKIALLRNSRKPCEQRTTYPRAAVLRPHEQIFKP